MAHSPGAIRAYSLSPWYAPGVGVYAALLVRMGENDRGKELLKKLGSGEAYGASKGLALFHTCCGEIDLAADWFEKAIKERDARAPVRTTCQVLDSDPWFSY